MSNVLLLHEGEQPTLMGTFMVLSRFFNKYGGAVRKQFVFKITESDLDWADLIVCVRGDSPVVYSVLRYAKAIGKKVIYFLDDDMKDIPKGSFRYTKRTKWLLNCIRECSIIWSPNQLIVEEYLEFVNEHRGVVAHTAVKGEEIVLVPSDSDIIKIVYAASESHTANFNKNIAPILPELFAEYGDRIELFLIGLHPQIDLGRYNSRLHYIDGMALEEYYKFMRKHHYDIGLAPLVTTHFTERKYFNKYIEYSKTGICGIYSDVMPFQLVVKDGYNGYMTENSSAAWLKTIKKAIDSKEERETIVKMAQEHLRKEHCEDVIFAKLAKDLPELIEYRAPDIKSKWPTYVRLYRVKQLWFHIMEMFYLTFFSLTHFGISTTIEKIKRKINKGEE